MLKLIKPNENYYKQYKEMMDEWKEDGSRIAPWPLHLEYATKEQFTELIKRIEEVEKGINLNGVAPSTTYWLYDDETDKLIGAFNLRHKIIGESGNLWGHIGYGIRPSSRRKGYATYLLKKAVEEAKKRNIKNIYVGTYTENIASCKTIEKCGFDFEELLIDKECGKEVKKYCYSFRKKYANGIKDYKNIEEIKTKTLSVDEVDFCGDICLYDFVKVNEKVILPNGICFIDTNYKWLEFYDYSSKSRLTAMYDNKGEIIEWYFDVSRKIGKENGMPYEDDLYLDVLVLPDGSQILLDKDELDDAFENNEISELDYNNAIKEAEILMKLTKGKEVELKKFTDKYLKKIMEI